MSIKFHFHNLIISCLQWDMGTALEIIMVVNSYVTLVLEEFCYERIFMWLFSRRNLEIVLLNK